MHAPLSSEAVKVQKRMGQLYLAQGKEKEAKVMDQSVSGIPVVSRQIHPGPPSTK